MKTMKSIFAMMALLVGTASLSSCSSDDDAVAPVVFPEATTLTVTPSTEAATSTLNFNASHAWALTSSKVWCQFKQGSAVVNSLTGEAGQQSVTIVVSADGQGFEETAAEISLKMEDQQQVIATVKRGGKAPVLTLSNGDVVYGEEKGLQLEYTVKMNGGSISEAEVTVNANFDWTISSKPEWVAVLDQNGEEAVAGKANEDKVLTISFAGDAAARVKAIDAADIVFGGVNNTTYKLPVSYTGMPANAIEFDPALANIMISRDGTEWWKSSLMGEETEKNYAPIEFTAHTPGAYKIIVMESTQWGYRVYDGEEYAENVQYGMGYINVLDEGDGHIAVKLNENAEKERRGLVMVLPQAVYDEIPVEYGWPNLDTLLDENDMNYVAEGMEKYILVDFTQEGASEDASGFHFIDPLTYQESTLEVATLEQMGMDPAAAMEVFGTTNVNVVILNADFNGIVICPNGYTLEEPMYELVNVPEGLFEEGMTNWPSVGMSLIRKEGQELPEGDMYVRFYDQTGATFGVVVLSYWT